MKRLTLTFVLACIGAFAQGTTCQQKGTFTSATSGATLDNRITIAAKLTPGCINLRLSYYSTGFSALSIQIQGAPDSSGAAGAFAAVASTFIVQGANPSVTLQGEIMAQTYFPWLNVKVNSVTGSGTIYYQLDGTNAPASLAKSGSGVGGVVSVFGRFGVVAAVSGDYSYAQISGTPTLFNQTVMDEAVALAQQPTLNFIGGGVTCVNNGGATRTDCTIPTQSPTGVTYGGVFLSNAVYINAQVAASGTGNIDVFTCPSAKRCLVGQGTLMNNNAGTVTYFPEIKIGAVYYRLQGTASTSATATPGSIIHTPIVLEATDKFAVNVDVATQNIFVPIIQYDATSSLFSPRITSTVNGANTVYTVTTGKTAMLLGPSMQPFSNTTLLVLTNQSGGAIAVTPHLVPFGGAVNANNLFGTAATAVGNNAKTTITINASMASGDFIDATCGTVTTNNVLFYLLVAEV